jgi:uncharacterized protein YbjT (DUF2867 family)
VKVAVFGGTGYIGSYLIDELISQNHTPVVLARQGSESSLRQADKCQIVAGHAEDERAVTDTIRGCDAVIYNIGILREIPARGITFRKLHFETAKRCMDTAVECGTLRFILMSANGVRPDGTEYQKTKYMAEQYLAATGLQWTIFRPSVVFGDPRGKMEFATRLRNDIINSPLPMPLFHDGLLPVRAGAFKLSPVHVTDVAKAFVRALDNENTFTRILPLGGPHTLAWKTILATIAEASERHKLAAPVPAWAVKFVAGFFDQYEWFPVTADQIRMLMEGNTCNSAETMAMLQIEPIPFTTTSLAYLSQ